MQKDAVLTIADYQSEKAMIMQKDAVVILFQHIVVTSPLENSRVILCYIVDDTMYNWKDSCPSRACGLLVTGIASRAHIIDPIGGPLKYLILAVQGMLVILMMTKIATRKYLFDQFSGQ